MAQFIRGVPARHALIALLFSNLEVPVLLDNALKVSLQHVAEAELYELPATDERENLIVLQYIICTMYMRIFTRNRLGSSISSLNACTFLHDLSDQMRSFFGYTCGATRNRRRLYRPGAASSPCKLGVGGSAGAATTPQFCVNIELSYRRSQCRLNYYSTSGLKCWAPSGPSSGCPSA